jgi:stalled ribosome rescue protein Dom34
MTEFFKFEDEDVFKYLIKFCASQLKEQFEEYKKEKSARILRAPGFFKYNIVGYFFEGQNILVLTDTADPIDKIIKKNNINDSLREIREVNEPTRPELP